MLQILATNNDEDEDDEVEESVQTFKAPPVSLNLNKNSKVIKKRKTVIQENEVQQKRTSFILNQQAVTKKKPTHSQENIYENDFEPTSEERQFFRDSLVKYCVNFSVQANDICAN